jgi:hypothetical protein
MRVPEPRTSLLLFLAATLYACGSAPTGGKASDDSGRRADAAATPAAITLTPKGAPMRRAGYWQITRDEARAAGQFHCVDEASEAKFSLFDWLAMVGDCNKKEFTRTASGWNFDTKCTLMGMVTEQKGTLSGDFQDTYTIDQVVTTGRGVSEKGALHGKWLGQCPAGLKPGDFADSDGKKLGNVLGSTI